MDRFDMIPNPDDFRQGAGDDKLLVVFHMDILQDETASTEAGRPIFHDAEFVRIFVPGDKTNVIDRPIRPSDRVRFPKQYEAFKAGADDEAQLNGTGTPLRDWPLVGRAQVAEFHYFGIRTVEQLADVRDDICGKIPGLTKLKHTAGIWLKKAESTAEAAKIATQVEEMKASNDQLQKTVADLMITNSSLQDQMRALLTQRTETA